MTAATDATTVEPSSGAFMSPMISSSANSTAATGVLNAAASAPAAPTGTRSRTRSGEQVQPLADDRREAGADLHRRPLAAHRVARPDAQHAGEELAERDAAGDHAAREVVGRLGLGHAAAAHVRKHLRQQHARDDADEHGDREEAAHATGRDRTAGGWSARSPP